MVMRLDTAKQFKTGSSIIMYPHYVLINMLIDKCVFPSYLKKADATPISKKGVIHDK